MRAILVYPTIVLLTLVFGVPIIMLTALGRRIDPDSLLGRAPGIWCRIVLRVAGVRVVVRNPEYIAHGDARIYVSNHVSWFDVFALGSLLPHFRFVAKKELASLPIFGPAVKQVAGIFIDRKNRRAAFDAYSDAARQIDAGVSVVVYPEGTRGRSYQLRPFKKGPFVLAIAAQVPLVPVVVHGTREVQGKGEIGVHAGTCELTFLEPISTAGLTYDDRDQLVQTVWHRMAVALEREYGVTSPGRAIDTQTTAA